jgi:hypothetical protein
MPSAATPMAPSWGLGPVTSPHLIFSFVQASGLPDYCGDPKRMLLEMRRRIVADGAGCVATPLEPTIDGALRMQLWCVMRNIRDPQTGELRCRDSYVAEVWPERSEILSSQYDIQSFSWVRRTCGAAFPGTYAEMSDDLDLATIAATSSARLESFLETCRPAAR